MKSQAYIAGMSTPCVYRHESEPSVAWRHGDDIGIIGEDELLERVFSELQADDSEETREARLGGGRRPKRNTVEPNYHAVQVCWQTGVGVRA